MFEFGFVRAKLDSVWRLYITDALALLGSEVTQ